MNNVELTNSQNIAISLWCLQNEINYSIKTPYMTSRVTERAEDCLKVLGTTSGDLYSRLTKILMLSKEHFSSANARDNSSRYDLSGTCTQTMMQIHSLGSNILSDHKLNDEADKILTQMKKQLENAFEKQEFENVIKLLGQFAGSHFYKYLETNSPEVSMPNLKAFLIYCKNNDKEFEESSLKTLHRCGHVETNLMHQLKDSIISSCEKSLKLVENGQRNLVQNIIDDCRLLAYLSRYFDLWDNIESYLGNDLSREEIMTALSLQVDLSPFLDKKKANSN